MAVRSCSVVRDITCEAAPGFSPERAVGRCYACGEDVCRTCSALVRYRRRRCRLCAWCCEMYGIAFPEPPPLPEPDPLAGLGRRARRRARRMARLLTTGSPRLVDVC